MDNWRSLYRRCSHCGNNHPWTLDCFTGNLQAQDDLLHDYHQAVHEHRHRQDNERLMALLVEFWPTPPQLEFPFMPHDPPRVQIRRKLATMENKEAPHG